MMAELPGGPSEAAVTEHFCRRIFWDKQKLIAECVCGWFGPPRETKREADQDADRHWQRLDPLPDESAAREASIRAGQTQRIEDWAREQAAACFANTDDEPGEHWRRFADAIAREFGGGSDVD